MALVLDQKFVEYYIWYSYWIIQALFHFTTWSPGFRTIWKPAFQGKSYFENMVFMQLLVGFPSIQSRLRFNEISFLLTVSFFFILEFLSHYFMETLVIKSECSQYLKICSIDNHWKFICFEHDLFPDTCKIKR